MSEPISIISTAIYLPGEFETGEEISQKSGIPREVVEKKMGIIKKSRAPHDCHPSFMGVEAARKALEGMDPESIDLIIWTGSDWKDYNVWSAGIFVQRELNLVNAYSFDLAARCSSNVVGLKVARSLMKEDPKIKRALLCGGHRTGDLVNYQDPTSRFLYNLSDGGSAIVLERGDENPILESSVITDGAFSLDVIIPGGGTRDPWRNGVAAEKSYLTVPDVDGMRQRLAEKSIQNFLKVIREARAKSSERPIDYLALLHMKRSAHDVLLDELNLKQEQSIYMDHYGHFGAPDQVLSLGLAERRGLLKPGDHVVLASAGIGYTWSAISLQWNKPTFKQTTLDNFEN